MRLAMRRSSSGPLSFRHEGARRWCRLSRRGIDQNHHEQRLAVRRRRAGEHHFVVAHWEPTVLRGYALVADGERGILIGPTRRDGLDVLSRAGTVLPCSLRSSEGAAVAELSGRAFSYGGPATRLAPAGSWMTDTGAVECSRGPHLHAPSSEPGFVSCSHCGPTTAPEVSRVCIATTTGAGAATAGSFPFVGKAARDGGPQRPPPQPRTGTLEHRRREQRPADRRRRGMVVDRRVLAAAPPPAAHGHVADRDAHHTHTVLSGLTSASGAMVSGGDHEPSDTREGAQYDYRYAWVRDRVSSASPTHRTNPSLLDDAVRFVTRDCTTTGPTSRPRTP